MPELKVWTCNHCGIEVVLPSDETEYDAFLDTIMRIREHRFAHLVEALMAESDEEMLGLCEDEPAGESYSGQSGPYYTATVAPVGQEDVAPILAGIEELLRADLPRARQLWYPINEDGGFNR